MLSSNVDDLKDKVALRLRDKGITSMDDEDYVDALNAAQDLLCEKLRIFHKKSNISTVIDTQAYNLPSDYMSLYNIDAVVYTDSDSVDHRLTKRGYEEVRRYSDLTTRTGTPQLFYLKEDQIYFYPTPDYTGSSNVEIEHFYYVENLTGGTNARTAVLTITNNYSATSYNNVILCDGTLTITLPIAADNSDVKLTIKNISTGTVTISNSDGATIDGDSSYLMATQYETIEIVCNGTSWYITARY